MAHTFESCAIVKISACHIFSCITGPVSAISEPRLTHNRREVRNLSWLQLNDMCHQHFKTWVFYQFFNLWPMITWRESLQMANGNFRDVPLTHTRLWPQRSLFGIASISNIMWLNWLKSNVQYFSDCLFEKLDELHICLILLLIRWCENILKFY